MDKSTLPVLHLHIHVGPQGVTVAQGDDLDEAYRDVAEFFDPPTLDPATVAAVRAARADADPPVDAEQMRRDAELLDTLSEKARELGSLRVHLWRALGFSDAHVVTADDAELVRRVADLAETDRNRAWWRRRSA